MDRSAPTLTARELDYLRTQLLGRLATVDATGAPQNNPVGFVIDEATGQLLIGGLNMGTSRKFRNVTTNPNVAFVVDDLASTDPWTPRGVEVRGQAEALADVEPPMPGFSREIIRITPSWIGSWGVETDSFHMTVRRADQGDSAPSGS
jgi:pyridoxamine 5'-phosphate oxidase family protein